MGGRYRRGMLHLAAALDLADHPGTGPRTELVRLAEHGRLDFVTLDDPVGRPGPEALDLVSAMAAATRRIGLVPRRTDLSGHLDRVAQGRAGRWIEVPDAGVGEAGRAAGVPEAGESPFLAGGLGDHPVDADGVRDEGAGPAPSYRLAPLHLVDASTRGARALAARYADVALVRAATPAGAAAVREELRVRAAKSGRAPGALRVLVSLRVDLGGGECAAEPGHGGGGPGPPRRARCTGAARSISRTCSPPGTPRAPPTASTWSPSNPAATWNGWSTARWRYSSTAACSAPSIRVAPCASTWAWPAPLSTHRGRRRHRTQRDGTAWQSTRSTHGSSGGRSGRSRSPHPMDRSR